MNLFKANIDSDHVYKCTNINEKTKDRTFGDKNASVADVWQKGWDMIKANSNAIPLEKNACINVSQRKFIRLTMLL